MRDPTPVSRLTDPPILETAYSSVWRVREISGLRPAPPLSRLKIVPELVGAKLFTFALLAECGPDDTMKL